MTEPRPEWTLETEAAQHRQLGRGHVTLMPDGSPVRYLQMDEGGYAKLNPVVQAQLDRIEEQNRLILQRIDILAELVGAQITA